MVGCCRSPAFSKSRASLVAGKDLPRMASGRRAVTPGNDLVGRRRCGKTILAASPLQVKSLTVVRQVVTLLSALDPFVTTCVRHGRMA